MFQRNHSLFGSVWSSMRRGHGGFPRALSLKVNPTQIKFKLNYLRYYFISMPHYVIYSENSSVTKSLCINEKVSPTNSIDYLPYNSIQRAVTEGMNHITSMTKTALGPHTQSSAVSMREHYGPKEEEVIPLRPLTVSSTDPERTYGPCQIIELWPRLRPGRFDQVAWNAFYCYRPRLRSSRCVL
uniref:Uncharacterized protein n=1 Tax=Timema poppense TaxID=170557 RepID=A0A7R9D5N2_TIMPO|nr:unnamed protein product [Timema poppensis]